MQVGYRYFTVVEDSITSLILHCSGWISVFIDPARPCFLGACTSSLNDMLVQQTRWSFGLMQIGLSKYCPLIYGTLRMSFLQCLCYSSLVFDALYVIPFYSLALIPQICLLHGIPLYPKVSVRAQNTHKLKRQKMSSYLVNTCSYVFTGFRSILLRVCLHLFRFTTQACARSLLLWRFT